MPTKSRMEKSCRSSSSCSWSRLGPPRLPARKPRRLESSRPAAPGIHEVPARGTSAMAAASTVNATKSSFSR